MAYMATMAGRGQFGLPMEEQFNKMTRILEQPIAYDELSRMFTTAASDDMQQASMLHNFAGLLRAYGNRLKSVATSWGSK